MEHAHHGTTGMSHGSAQEYLRRFWVVTFLLVPLVFTHEAASRFLGVGPLPYAKWIGFVIATAIFGFALVFFKHAWHEIKMRAYGMMTLVSLAVGAGYLFSAASTFISALEAEFYLEVSTLVWVLLFGHYMEARSSSAAGDALGEVAKLLPKKAHKIVYGQEEEDVEVSALEAGDLVRVKPGEKIPADGVISDGAANVDESLISGESKPVRKEKGDRVAAGSICVDGSLTVSLEKVGEHSTVGQIEKLIAEAQHTKPMSQRIADKAAAVLTFVAGAAALATLLAWSLVMGESFVFSATLAITVLVIACPHALGLAIPTVTTVTTSLAAKNGVFIKNLAKLEVVRRADYVVFDKTGTLTKGEFGVTDIVAFGEGDALSLAASLERHSSHVIGQSVVKYAEGKGCVLSDASNFRNIAGKGISGIIGGREYAVGNKTLMEERGVFSREAEKAFRSFSEKGKTTIFVADTERILGVVALADTVKEESYEAVEKLHQMGIQVAMLTGDNSRVAAAVSRELGIDTFFSEVLPDEKYRYIKKLQENGGTVLMVGDGVNDAPALAQAHAGIATGAGTDVAVEAGDVVLIRSNPLDVVRLIYLSKKVYVKMIQNLVWALGYNVIAIPAAAGAFAAWGVFLRPEVGALIMSLSTVIVVLNALTLKRTNLQTV